MKKVATAISLFTLLPVFSLAATGLTNLEENITRAVVNSVSNSQQQTKMSYDAVLKIMKNLNSDWDYRFNDKHTKITTAWNGPSFNFQRTSDGFWAQETGLNSTKINCGVRLDGFYVVGHHTNVRHNYKYREYIADRYGKFVNKRQILTNYQNRNLNSLNKIQTFNKMNKSMISSILVAYGIYSIDYVNEGEVSSIYGDALDKNIEIKFIKQDNKTIYGTLFVSKNDADEENSEIYVFKYLDQTTPNKQRVKLMTKRVIQNDLNEQSPNTKKYISGQKTKKSQKVHVLFSDPGIHLSNDVKGQYEEFLSEGVVHTTYTKVNGKLYKNQKELF